MNSYPYNKICFSLVSDLSDRTKDIVVRRFGLESQEPETLESIGQAHGITRERVRQIVEDGLSQIRENVQAGKEQEKLQAIFQSLANALKEGGHIKRQDLLVDTVSSKDDANHTVFILHLGDQFYRQKETEHVHPFWASKKEVFESAPIVLQDLLNHFEQNKQPASLEELANAYGKTLASNDNGKATAKSLASLLEVSKYITQGYNGKWGLRKWPEIYPKGMRDKAYVVLRDTGKPLHFVDVAKLIDQLQGALVEQKKKEILPQTVHNELIKDPRFVLVGRGTYGLSEWGYKPGTVKEVLLQILRENGPITKEDLIGKTLEQRQVKESTILLNLQDKKSFARDEYGRYYLIV